MYVYSSLKVCWLLLGVSRLSQSLGNSREECEPVCTNLKIAKGVEFRATTNKFYVNCSFALLMVVSTLGKIYKHSKHLFN